MTVEGSVDLPVVVTILFEDISQEHQLGLQAVFITESSGHVHQSRQYTLFIGWVMVGLGFEEEIGVCGLAVQFVAQRAMRSPVIILVQEWEVMFASGFHGYCLGGVGSPSVEGVIYVAKPAAWISSCKALLALYSTLKMEATRSSET
jgi:hypothetical protein